MPCKSPCFCLLLVAFFSLTGFVQAQQQGDTLFVPTMGPPSFDAGTGPLVLIDAAHNNFHTSTGRYRPFADVLRREREEVEQQAPGVRQGSLQDLLDMNDDGSIADDVAKLGAILGGAGLLNRMAKRGGA